MKRIQYWMEWATSALSLTHVYLVAHDVIPYYKFTGIAIATLWLVLAVMWRKTSLILLNAIMIAIYIQGMMK
jgi:hypothetical protein